MIGLGKMGGYMTEHLLQGGHKIVGYDRDAAVVQKTTEKGAQGADSLEALVSQLKAPRAIWLVVPAGAPVDETIAAFDLTADALKANPKLDGIQGYVTDSGEGRWTAIAGIELGVPLPVITAALDARFRSQDPEPFANKLLAMMRHEFGGHAVKTVAK